MRLSEACSLWQSGRDDGSSPIRGGARLLTGIPHYFEAPFLAAHEAQAQDLPKYMDAAECLLEALAGSTPRTAAEWHVYLGLPAGDFIGRGIKSKEEYDSTIQTRLETGTLSMALWGASLDESIAREYGERFLFQFEGPFRAIPAWIHSSQKNGERELITGGHYKVLDIREELVGAQTTTKVRLQEIL